MEYSQAIKNLKTNILKIKEGLDILDKSSNRKSTSFIQEITKSIKDFEFNTKKLKLDLKSIGIESKQIEKELKDAKGILTQQDFVDLLSTELINSNPSNKELALLLVLEKPVIELKGIIAKKIKSKYLQLSHGKKNVYLKNLRILISIQRIKIFLLSFQKNINQNHFLKKEKM
ncbi:MAG: hypothetical protein IPH52_15440 [Leptospiraceae bacterium]|nr:hypothetical protein [Leptospiraceae bacterium]